MVSAHLIGSQVSPDITWARVIVDKRDLRVSFAAHGCRTALKVCEGPAVRSFIVQFDIQHQGVGCTIYHVVMGHYINHLHPLQPTLIN
jgi:hypothetical protein